MDNTIIDKLEATYSEELTPATGNLGALEEAVKAKMPQLGRDYYNGTPMVIRAPLVPVLPIFDLT